MLFQMSQVGMEIEVRPGLVSKDNEGKLTCRPIFSRIVSLFAEQNELQFAVPGGLIGTLIIYLTSVVRQVIVVLIAEIIVLDAISRCWNQDRAHSVPS